MKINYAKKIIMLYCLFIRIHLNCMSDSEKGETFSVYFRPKRRKTKKIGKDLVYLVVNPNSEIMTNLEEGELAILEKYRVTLDNVTLQSEIASIMLEYGYSADTISAGINLLSTARVAFDNNKREDNETLFARNLFDTSKAELTEKYRGHRKRAKVIFKNNPVQMSVLGIDGSMPEAYLPWLEMVKKFYSVALENERIKQTLLSIKVTAESLTEAQALIPVVEQYRANWLREVGESQDATKKKDQAIADISLWMRDFYDIAKIALEDRPQLLESLGLVIRS